MKKCFLWLVTLVLLLGLCGMAQADASASLTEPVAYAGVEISVPSPCKSAYDKDSNTFLIHFADNYILWRATEQPSYTDPLTMAFNASLRTVCPDHGEWDSGFEYASYEDSGKQMVYIFFGGDKAHFVICCDSQRKLTEELHALFDEIMATARLEGDEPQSSAALPEEPLEGEEQFKGKCQPYTYASIAQDPQKVKGERAVISGKVIRVMENGPELSLRVNLADHEGEYSNAIFVTYTRKDDKESRISANDIVTIWGRLSGVQTYTTMLGSQQKLPSLLAEYIEIDSTAP